MNTYFVDWVYDQMKQRGWGLMDLHRASGLDAGGLSNLLAGKRNPGLKTCKALARAFNLSPEVVLQVAGELGHRSTQSDDAYIVEIKSLYDKFNPQNKREAVEFFRMLMKLQDEQRKVNAKPDAVPPE